jgi:hypothetical protein
MGIPGAITDMVPQITVTTVGEGIMGGVDMAGIEVVMVGVGITDGEATVTKIEHYFPGII